MSKRRGNNEGSIHQRANGVWRTQVTLNGRRLNFAGQSRKVCRAWIKETIQHIDQGFILEGGDMTLVTPKPGLVQEGFKFGITAVDIARNECLTHEEIVAYELQRR